MRTSSVETARAGADLAIPLVLAARGRRARPRAPTFWTVATQADFLKGDVEDLSIDSDGRVFLGPSPALVAETAAPFLWTVLALPDGSLLAGTGNEGKVLRVDRDGKMSTFFDAAELEVHALAPAPGGGLYVATSPDGKIYQVAPTARRRPSSIRTTSTSGRWRSTARGNVFAATGDKGVIYKITPDGREHASTRRTRPTSCRWRLHRPAI